ncbi:GlsB/YeaQ/YmgE family stress response membrane protein [Runella aurantiaca]|uniref:GlsB/YeaQ/YmgE family stress response membrane protein n=1 Tax=Runella aurantiaca TaxID=2282308 RepID=A0A369IAI0_9BACT|nr:GlsB/YeaQ/YmgE family stress response membrane protein [Runella aurantiaca]RDB05477.1 GlsB/YeaQ/YmgE family stress response membrane protein [Runella aurantiaca]
MNIIITIVVGAVAGWLADLAFKRFSFSTLYQILLGIAGAFVGGYLFDGEFHTMLGLPDFISRVLEAFSGAAIILLAIILYRSLTAKK